MNKWRNNFYNFYNIIYVGGRTLYFFNLYYYYLMPISKLLEIEYWQIKTWIDICATDGSIGHRYNILFCNIL